MLETTFNLFTGSTTLWFAAAALLVFMVATAVGSVTVFRSELAESDFRRKADLMPAFAELQAAEAALGERRREHNELLEELSSLRREQAEAQRHELDAQHWQSLAEQAKRDYDNRQELVDEVERLRTAYEDAAKDLAARNEDLAELIRERSKLGVEIEEAQKRLEALEEQRQNAEDLTEQLEAMGERRDALLKELDDIKDQRDERLRAAFEVDQLARRRVEIEKELEALPNEVEGLAERRDTLRNEIDDLQREADRLREARNELDRVQERKVALETAIESLEREKERLKASVASISGVGRTIGDDQPDEKRQTADLTQRPTCLFGDGDTLLLPDTVAETDEAKMLSHVKNYLEELNLDFEERILYRFHTSLKTEFISPLTVLAGISGTGKSQLPQRYAEAMGIHFLKVAVQPRWDSPQDLLGFYNYLEKSYKATELARALVRMDSSFPLPTDETHAGDRVLLVLLDEMNLSRVEYYFSEFLSRLEGRPDSSVTDQDLRLPGKIDFDVPRKDKEPLSVYPGHNVLFAGTMNEDESTQTLSDKVLDRANILRFRKPEQLRSETMEEPEVKRHTHLPFDTWKSWQRRSQDLQPTYQEMTSDFVLELNELLVSIGRPFGHRVNQAIHAYVANYPDLTVESQVQRALADTLALRILPKLRGIELEDPTPQVLEQIANLTRDKLGDDDLANSITQGRTGTDVFNWAG